MKRKLAEFVYGFLTGLIVLAMYALANWLAKGML